MATFLVFLTVTAILSSALSVSGATFAPHAKLKQRELKKYGYECGEVFFSDQQIKDSVAKAMPLTEGVKPNMASYTGPLFNGEMDLITLNIFPDKSHLKKESGFLRSLLLQGRYRIVLDRDAKMKDMIVRTGNGDFTRCWRIENSLPKASEINVGETNGYQCGHKLISDETVRKYASIAQTYLGLDYLYPAPYHGNLYPESSGLLMWPIYSSSKLYLNPKWSGGSSFILINTAGQLKDVIIRTASHNYIRCTRSKIALPATNINVFEDVMPYLPKSGFMCENVFFDDRDLLVAASVAKKSYGTSFWQSHVKYHEGPPFKSPCFLWPIKASGELQSTEISQGMMYRLVISTTFQVMSVAMEGEDFVKRCEKRMFPRK